VEYEFTLVFELNQQHMAQVSKDRTGLFRSLPEVKLTSDIGMLINDWCTNAPEQIKSESHDYFKTLIDDCKSMVELVNLYNNHEDRQKDYKDEFIRKKNELNTNLNYLNNGTHH
jgi:Mg2+ and Co2+ transporter CorA